MIIRVKICTISLKTGGTAANRTQTYDKINGLTFPNVELITFHM